jgi:hypothetical protein
MTNEQQNIALAKRDGIKGTIYPEDGIYVCGPFTGYLPDYDSDSKIDRMVRGLRCTPYDIAYCMELIEITGEAIGKAFSYRTPQYLH